MTETLNTIYQIVSLVATKRFTWRSRKATPAIFLKKLEEEGRKYDLTLDAMVDISMQQAKSNAENKIKYKKPSCNINTSMEYNGMPYLI
jgi:hypothetical protein